MLILTLSGSGRYEWETGEFFSQRNDLTLYCPGAFQEYRTAQKGETQNQSETWELVWAHFLPRPHWLPLLEWTELAPGLLHLRLDEFLPETERIRERLGAMAHYARGALARREEFAMNALEEALLLCDLQNPLSAQSRLDPRIRQALEFISQNCSQPLTLQAVADDCGLSLSRFGHLFREQVGETPGQFLEQQRMTRACQLLTLTSRTVTAIAEEVGYESAFYFSNRFRRLMGCSPREYRR